MHYILELPRGEMSGRHMVAKIGWATAVLLALIGITSVVGRFVMLTGVTIDPPVSEPVPHGFNDRYIAHPYMTVLHILPGFLVMALGPVQFIAKIRAKKIQVHRWFGRIFVASSLVAGIAALSILFAFPVFGSFTAPVALLLFGPMYLFCVTRAYVHIRRRQIPQHREWMIRAFALALGISTFRVFMFTFVSLTEVSILELWDTGVWLSFTINLIIAEIWINVTRTPARSALAPQQALAGSEGS